MGFLESVIPGYKGYRQREDSRNSDKQLRDFLANKLRQTRRRYEDIKIKIADKGNLDLLKPAEKISQRLSRVIDRLVYANYGFSGKWWGENKIGIEKLNQVYQFDQQLVEAVEDFEKEISELEQIEHDQEIESKLESLIVKITQNDEALDNREAILRTIDSNQEDE